jgi:hypothetical protein
MSDITNDQEAACTYSHVCLTDGSELIDDLKTGLLHNALSAASWTLKVSSSFCLQNTFPNTCKLHISHYTCIYCIKYIHLHIDGPVRLVRLDRLQKDNFRLFLRQQTDRQQTSVCKMTKW